ncbi:MAG: helix-turn-helix transcriptional regulator [Alphaproteobacteria bacterium]|nr:helix-turn-helix transcriptional regulator [Alphaproteobacteria bacterium]
MITRPLSARQIKAARALLDWSQEELAYAARLSIATIRKLELGHISPRGETTRLIHQAVEDAGLEFIDSDGVRRRLEDISVFRGVDGTDQFLDDIKETTRHAGGGLVVVASSVEELENICGAGDCPKLETLLKQNDDLSIKCLLTEVGEPQLSTPRLQFRTISKQYVDTISFYVYGDKYALIPTDKDAWPKIVVVKSTSVAESFRRQFFSLWEKATPGYVVPKNENKKPRTKANISGE